MCSLDFFFFFLLCSVSQTDLPWDFLGKTERKYLSFRVTLNA